MTDTVLAEISIAVIVAILLASPATMLAYFCIALAEVIMIRLKRLVK